MAKSGSSAKKTSTSKKASSGKHDRKPSSEQEEISSLERQIKHFGEELSALGRKVERNIDEKGDNADSWYHRTFGPVGPLISSVLGVLMVGLGILAITLINFPLDSAFLEAIKVFLADNLGVFFGIFLFFSYSSYFSRAAPKAYRPFYPLIIAISLTIAAWMLSTVLLIANAFIGWAFLTTLSMFILDNLFWILGGLVVIGYIAYAIGETSGKPLWGKSENMPVRMMKGSASPKKGKEDVRRLYRSGEDKILGGVCGGIAKYFRVDPVIIRILWVVFTLIWGIGMRLIFSG